MASFYRDIFTGELKERESSPTGGEFIGSTTIPEGSVQGRANSPWSRPWVSTSLAVPIEQTAAFNEAARRAGTGAYYKPNPKTGYADLVCETRGARKRELRSRGKIDYDGMYGD